MDAAAQTNSLVGPEAKPRSLPAAIIGLASAALAMVCVFQGIQQVLIPYQVLQIDAAHKVGVLALLTTLAAALAVVGSLAGGALSDRTSTRFGRRSPWLVAMAVISIGLMVSLAVVRTLTAVAVIYAVLWFCMNFYQSVLNAIIPDRIPQERRGVVSSAFGLGAALGLALGVNAVAPLTLEQGYLALAGVMFAATAACVILVHEGATPEAPATALQAAACRAPAPKGPWLGIFEAFLELDFALAFITRAMAFTALATVWGYTYYILQDHIGSANLPYHNVKGAIGILVDTQTVAWIVGGAGAGWLADRLDRRKLFVGICSIGMAVSMLVPLTSPTWTGMVVFYALMGLFFGVYLSVDLALMTLVLPSRENEGRDLAVLSIANAGPQLLSPVIAATIISTAGYDALFLFGFIVSLLSGVAVFFIRSVR
jgi:MFS family permease